MRRRRAVKRELVPDVKYNSELVARLINTIMTRGKKSTAQNIVYGALDVIQSKKPDMPAIDVFMQALENVKPKLEVKSRRVGGATYQVPMPVKKNRQQTLAIRWVLISCRDKKGQPMHVKLANELLAAYNREGASIAKRENVHRMAEANKAFAHFRF